MKQLLLIAALLSHQLFTQAQTPATPYIQNLNTEEENIVRFPLDIIGQSFTYPSNGTWRWRSSLIKISVLAKYTTGPTSYMLQHSSKQTVVNIAGGWRFNDFSINLPPLYAHLAYAETTYTLTIWHELNGQKSEELVYHLRKPGSEYTPPGWYTPEKL